MEVPEWLTNAIIVLVVILVIGMIIYLIAPDTYKDIFNIAEETFQIGEEEKKAEAAREIISSTIEAFDVCVKNAVEGCSCVLDESKLPNGYLIWLKNTENEAGEKTLKLQAFTPDGAAISNAEDVPGISARLAVSGHVKYKSGEEKEGIMCAERDMRIWNDNGRIRIGEENSVGQVQWFDFYNNELSNQVVKSRNMVCFLTNAVESTVVGLNDVIPEGNDDFNLISEFEFPRDTREGWVRDLASSSSSVSRALANTISSNPEQERKRLAAEAIRKLPACTGIDRANYLVLWPVLPQNIISVDSCNDRPRQLASSLGTNIPLTVNEDSDVISPVSSGAVSDYCLENCGSDGMSITIYEIYGTGDSWPTGRRIKISGLKSIEEKYLVKGNIAATKITKGANVSAGDILGKSGAKISYTEDFPIEVSGGDNPEALLPFGGADTGDEDIYDIASRNPFEERFCSLPKLGKEIYKGEGCERIIALGGCTRAIVRGSLNELAEKISKLENGESGTEVLSFTQGGRYFGYMYVFPKNAGAYTDEWIGFDILAEDTPRPAICATDKHCLCLCEGENSCSSGICKTLSENGFNPSFVNSAVFVAEGAREKTIHFQRLGYRLGLCNTLPCI